ncbi:MAG: metal ABC transporter permease [Planctomycetales bacterium]|nr:metal ABC transporter permease [Planctomycetales bacterium]
MDLLFWAPVVCCGALAGASTGFLGTYIVGMRIPFLGICVSHAALAGAVFGGLGGLSGPMLLPPALAGAVIAALLLGTLDPQSARVDSNVLMGILFSLTMGLAFLGLGLYGVYGISDNEVRSLLWGSLNFCRWSDFYIMAAAAVLEIAVVAAFYKELRAILFSRVHAAAAGVPVVHVWTAFLILTSVVLTVNFQTVGGLMIYSLLTNPAVAAFLLVKGYGRALALSALFGLLSGLGGFLLAAATDLPTGAMIVILSSLLVGFSWAISGLRRRAGY